MSKAATIMVSGIRIPRASTQESSDSTIKLSEEGRVNIEMKQILESSASTVHFITSRKLVSDIAPSEVYLFIFKNYAQMPIQVLIRFAQTHPEFRIPELRSVSKAFGFETKLPPNPDVSRPFMVVEVEEVEHARMLAKRCVLIKSVLEFYASGSSYEELHIKNMNQRHLWSSFVNETTWKFSVTGYNQTIPKRRQQEVVERFSYMALKGSIDLVNPEQEFCCFEEYSPKGERSLRPRYEGDGNFICVYFGRLIAIGEARRLIQKFDVKKRAYYGNTSMDAEMSLLMANQTLPKPGKLMYDPFAGTGSMLYTVAEFGAFVIGSDIDGRQMRGRENTPGVFRSAAQYNIAHKILDLMTFDLTNNPWRCGGIFDAIVTDPPYGVRAGAKRLGRKPGISPRDSVTAMKDPETYVPPTHPYELSVLALDLVTLARYLLKAEGRLVFFLPTVTDEYNEVDIPVVEGMELIDNSLENFGGWGRRLITMVKTREIALEAPDLRPRESDVREMNHIPAHRDFREKYFAGFNKQIGVPQ